MQVDIEGNQVIPRAQIEIEIVTKASFELDGWKFKERTEVLEDHRDDPDSLMGIVQSKLRPDKDLLPLMDGEFDTAVDRMLQEVQKWLATDGEDADGQDEGGADSLYPGGE